MNILVAGGAGFIGCNFIKYMLGKYLDYKIINYDLLTYAGNLGNIQELQNHPNYHFVNGDINNSKLLEYVFELYKVDVVVNFAAESHVDRSIAEPSIFVKTNVLGTQTLLQISKDYKIKKYIQISTDEVYGSLGAEGYFTEETPIAPNSPYSASKAAADMIVLSYFKTYGMNVNITRCSNNYGPYQFPEKLIPLIITNALLKKDLPVYGDGKNIRDWIYVTDHCSAVDLVIHNGKPGEVYNIGSENERINIEIVETIVKKLGVTENLIKFVDDRLGHDRRYSINPHKIMNELGWMPEYSFDKGLDRTIHWYMENNSWWESKKD